MSKLDSVLQKAVTSVPDCVATGFIDLASGILGTIAGSPPECSWPYVGDCVSATDMNLDGRGRLVVADEASRAIRRVTLP